MRQVATRAVLHHQRDTRVGREARDHRRCEGQDLCILDVGSLDEYLSLHTRGIIRIEEEAVDAVALPQSGEFPPESLLAVGERLQLDDERSLVGTGTSDEVITLNLLTALDGRVGSQDRVYLVDDLGSTGHRGSWRHGDGTEECTRILIRHQSRLRGKHCHAQHDDTHDGGDDDSQRLAYQLLHDTFIFISGSGEGGIEGGMEAIYARHLLMALTIVRLQEDGTEGRRQRQGVQGRDEDSHGHRHTELTVERTRHTTHERHRDKHRGHHQRDRDDGARDLVHGVDRGRQRRLIALVELGMDGLNHHDGIVDHDGDSQQQGRQYEQVDGEAEHLEEEERTYQ